MNKIWKCVKCEVIALVAIGFVLLVVFWRKVEYFLAMIEHIIHFFGMITASLAMFFTFRAYKYTKKQSEDAKKQLELVKVQIDLAKEEKINNAWLVVHNSHLHSRSAVKQALKELIESGEEIKDCTISCRLPPMTIPKDTKFTNVLLCLNFLNTLANIENITFNNCYINTDSNSLNVTHNGYKIKYEEYAPTKYSTAKYKILKIIKKQSDED
ncbi:MAG: hypothetical protein ACI9CD_000893 [Candidatus Deianiraeaceae bacterium]|jgi:hypothetical protein